MRRLLAFALVAGVAAAPAGAALGAVGSPSAGPSPTGCDVPAGSWPMYQGDPAHSAGACSSINTADVGTLKPSWFTATGGTVSATPAVEAGTVYDGDSTGVFYALEESTGAKRWSFDVIAPQGCFLDHTKPYTEAHNPGFGEITSSAAVADVAGRRVVYLGAGGSLFALDATTGKCLWAQDTDPAKPTSSVEIESSPVVDTSISPPEVLVGNDDNSSSGIAVTGLMAFDAQNGALLWKYEPERDLTLTPAEFGGSAALALSCGDGAPNSYCNPAHVRDLPPNSPSYADACGDVWSSPALDSSFEDPRTFNAFEGSGAKAPAGWFPKRITGYEPRPRPDGLVVFGTGNCSASPNPREALVHGDYVDNQGIFALDPVTGVRVWNFVPPYDIYDNNPNEPWGGDDDFGSSASLVSVASSSVDASRCAGDHGTTTLAIEGSKSGTAYGLCEASGRKIWSNQIAQPGQLSADLVGAVGGMIGSPAVGSVSGKPTVFFTSAIPLPLSNDGVREPGDGDSNISSCPGAPAGTPVPPACPDPTVASNPERVLSLHAVDAATGDLVWHAASAPTYAAAAFTNGVVIDPETTAFAVAAYDASTGVPLWSFPLGAAPASGAAIVGDSVFLGAGEAYGNAAGESLPPQEPGIWSFSLSSTTPTINSEVLP